MTAEVGNLPGTAGVIRNVPRPNARLSGLLILLVAISLYGISSRWIDSREYSLLHNAPLSLAAGETTYSLHVQDDGNYNISLRVWPKEETAVAVEWLISGKHGVEERGSKEVWLARETFVGRAHLRPGDHTLRFRILTDRRQLDSFNPHIGINADDETYARASNRYDHLVTLSAALALTGVCLILLSLRSKPVVQQVSVAVRIEPPDRVKRFPGYGRDRRLSLSSFGYVATIFFAVMVTVMMWLNGAFRYTPRGLWVGLLNTRSIPPPTGERSDSVILRITAIRRPLPKDRRINQRYPYYFERHYLLNDEEVQEGELGTKLRKLLVTREERTLYVEGDSELILSDVIRVIDIAKGAYASHVVLLTKSKSRE